MLKIVKEKIADIVNWVKPDWISATDLTEQLNMSRTFVENKISVGVLDVTLAIIELESEGKIESRTRI